MEAEFQAGTKAGQGIEFTKNLIDEVFGDGTVKTPALLIGDNQGSLFMMNNPQIGQRTKHIDTKANYICKLVETKIIKTKYLKSEGMIADVDTKNLDNLKFIKHARRKRGHGSNY